MGIFWLKVVTWNLNELHEKLHGFSATLNVNVSGDLAEKLFWCELARFKDAAPTPQELH